MLCRARIKFLSHGNHNNLHINMRIGGTRRVPLFTFKMIVFFDTAHAYITHSPLHQDYIDILDFDKINTLIQLELDKYDYILHIFDVKDYSNKRLSTQQILTKLCSK